jgi:hypothetical protein
MEDSHRYFINNHFDTFRGSCHRIMRLIPSTQTATCMTLPRFRTYVWLVALAFATVAHLEDALDGKCIRYS